MRDGSSSWQGAGRPQDSAALRHGPGNSVLDQTADGFPFGDAHPGPDETLDFNE
jgi:hypothetical protein